ncbi:uncharacterized protein CXQ87_001616 [Candidozyma duobushaemuli]|uniref:C2H2-type domain-containing protein n=2 Tax=Candidozyma TaxID=3303203 RepID=A0ABX8I533_9ASCO|nr:uncharacterized protein CXQ87_001616 [[Candida] duobushaemulonis]PVH13511.1 hypothetical protein CXQ87_001616 [[Candida] duobushaemulonis]QWU88244.1 hypothetical protein CA3LBN_002509 [[Candida] haemuloni]
MFLIGPGLGHRPPLSFSLAAFLQKYLIRQSLFPALSGSNIHWIGNSTRAAAHSCAADDLELSLGNDQIELFDNYLAPAKQPEFNFPVELDEPTPWGFDFSVPDFSSTPSLSSSYQTSVSSYQEEIEPPKSHFALNMIGLHQPPQAFQDFRRSPNADSPATGCSESSASFMDELFMKNGPMPTNFASGYIESPPMAPVPQVRKRRVCESPEFEAKKLKVEHESFDDRKEARHVCPECNASFKVKSYLTRHARKHTNAMAFMCPFHDISTQDNFGNVIKSATKCHPTGGFSRRDTYKTHLKALHFIYPPGTKSSARNSTGGRCAGCFEYFESNARWLKYHIECDQCKGLQEHGRSVKGNGCKNNSHSGASGPVKAECYD